MKKLFSKTTGFDTIQCNLSALNFLNSSFSKSFGILGVIFFFGMMGNVWGQCSNSGNDYSYITTSGWTVGQSASQGSVWAGERVPIDNLVSGGVYQISTCGSSYDSQLTIFNSSGTTVGYNDDNGPACSGSSASLNLTASGGIVYAQVNEYNCLTNSTNTTISVTLISLPCSVGAASSSQSLCANTAMTSITHVTTGVTGITSSTGLPTGVTASYSSNTITISGTPSQTGTFNYTITPTGCSSTATGTIVVYAKPTMGTLTVNGNSNVGDVVSVCPGQTIGVSQSGFNNQGGTTYFYSDNTTGVGGWCVAPDWEIMAYGSITAANQVGGQNNVNNLGSFNYKINSPGTYILHANAVNGSCYGDGINRYITINTAPSAVTLTNSTICSGGTISASGGSGGTIYWQGTTSNGTSTSGGSGTTSPAITTAGTYFARALASNGCWGDQGSAAITVNAAPSSPNAGSDVTICAGSSTTLNGSATAPITCTGSQTSSNDTDQAIPDNNSTGISSIINVPTSCQNASGISSVVLNITHTWNADLDIFLKAPDGTQIPLAEDKGGQGDNYSCTFISGGSTLPTSDVSITGNVSPQTSFSSLGSGTAAGNWTLIVKDDAGSDVGTLTFWSITVPINQTQSVTYSWSNGASTQSTTVSPSSTTTYTMTATGNGCSTTDQVIVTITNPTVTATLAANDFVWTGATSTAWNVTSNWLQWNGSVYNAPAAFPNANTANVILPADAAGTCVPREARIGNYTINVNNITGETGHSFVLNNANARLNIHGSYTGGSWGNQTAGSTVNYARNDGQNQNIRNVTYSKLETSGSGTKTLAGAVTVSSVLTVGSGTTLDLGVANTLTLSGAGTPFVITGTFTPNTGTVSYSSGAQNITPTSYYSISTGGDPSTKTLVGNINVSNLLTLGTGVTFNAGSNTINLTGATTPFSGAGIFNAESSTVNYSRSGAQNVAAYTYNNLTISGSNTKTLSAGTTTVNGTLNLVAGTFAVSTRTLILNGPYISGTVSNMTTTSGSDLQFNCSGTGPFTLHNSTALGNLKINSSGQVYNLNSNMTISGNLILEAGTLGLNTRSFTFSGSNISKNSGLIDATNTAGTMTFGPNAAPLTLPADLFSSNSVGKLTVNRAGGITLGSNTTVSNTLTLTNGVLTTGPNTFTMNGSTLTRTAGSIDASNLSSNLNFGNTNALTLPASSIQQNVNNLTLNGVSGSLSLSQDLTILGVLTIGSGKTFVAGNDTLNFTGTGNVLNVNGTFTPATSTVNFANATGIQNIPALTYNKILSSNFGTRVLTGNVIANDDVTNIDGSLNLNDFNLTIGGNYSNSVGADGFGNFGLVPGIGSVIFNKASGSQTLFMEAGSDFSNIQHTGAGTLYLASDLTMTGNLTNTAGTISALSADGQQSFGITIQGDWSNSAIFDPGTGYVLFEKSNGTQTVDNGTSTFYQMKQFGGASLTFSNTPEIKHDIVVNGPIATTSHFKLTGSNNQTISGSISEIAIQDMTVNKTSGIVTLSRPVKVNGTLTMTAGDLITDATNILEIGTSASSVGSVSWTAGTVRGPMKRWFAAGADATQAGGIFPVGATIPGKGVINRYAQVNFTQATPGGYIIAEYKTGSPSIGYAGLPLNYSSGSYPQAIQNYEEEGYWDITPYSAAGASYAALDDKPYTLKLRLNNPSTLTTGWTPSNDGNDLYNASTIRLIRSKGSSSGTHGNWELAGTHVSATESGNGDYYLTSSNITGFSWFNGGGNNQNPLPVELVSFSGACDEGIINLTWQTASEFNSSHFDVEKSRDGENWQLLTTLPSAGTSNELITYQSTDQNGTEGNNYFRLRQVDIDGTEKLYDPINVSCSEVTTGYFSSFPNPSGTSFQVVVNNKELIGACTLNMVDASGKVIEQRTIDVKEGINLFVINQELNPGIYFLNITNGAKSTQILRHAVK